MGKSLYKAVTGCIIVAIVVAIILKITGWRLQLWMTPCMMHDYFKLYCPGCGGTRAVQSLMGFHFIRSFFENPIVLYVFVQFAYYYIGMGLTFYKKNGKQYYHFHMWYVWVGIALMLVQCIVRNVLMIQFHIDYLGELVGFW